MPGENESGLNSEAALIAEKMRHTIDLLKAEINALKTEQLHQRQMADHRLQQLEDAAKDHEARIRQLTEGVTTFKVWSGLWNGGASMMSIAAFIRAWLGG